MKKLSDLKALFVEDKSGLFEVQYVPLTGLLECVEDLQKFAYDRIRRCPHCIRRIPIFIYSTDKDFFQGCFKCLLEIHLRDLND